MANWKGTAVPNSGVYQTIYINTALSTEEVVNILEKLNFISLSDFEAYSVMSVDYSSTGGNEGVNYPELTVLRTGDQLMIMAGYNPIFDSITGWYEGIETSLINTREGITFMNTADSDEGLIPVGDQNEKLSSIFSITPFIQYEPITNLPEFLTGIADAIREKKGTTDKINAQNMRTKIKSIKGRVEPLTITENGVYSNLVATETATVNQDTMFDFEISVDGYGLSLKKFKNFKMIDDVSEFNDEKYFLTYTGILNGEPEMRTVALSELEYDCDSIMCRPKDDLYAYYVVWVKDASTANSVYGTDKFENNTLYLSNYTSLILEAFGMGDQDWSLTISAPSTSKLDGVMPITVNVSSGVSEVDELPDVDSVTPYTIYGKKRYTDIVIYYNSNVNVGSIAFPCYGIEVVETLPTQNEYYTILENDYYKTYYYYVKPENQLYVFYKEGDTVTTMTVEELLSNALGTNMSFKGIIHVKDMYETQTDGFSLVYKYDYYMCENYILNNEVTQRWVSINTNNISYISSLSKSQASVTLTVSLGDYQENAVGVYWFVNRIPFKVIHQSTEQVNGYHTISLSVAEIFAEFGSGGFDVSVTLKNENSGVGFEDVTISTYILINEDGDNMSIS